MSLNIAGYIPTSFLDYPGKTAAVIFFAGCQFRCPFCHNPELALPSGSHERLDAALMLSDLKKRAPFLDGVCITGGEPTLQGGLISFIEAVHSLGLKIKLDTNGARPEVLSSLLSRELINYTAMDIKAPQALYQTASGWDGDISLVEKSIEVLMSSSVELEFRTTLVPGIHREEDAPALGSMIKGAPLFVLQNFRPGNTLNPSYSGLKPFSEEFLEKFRQLLLPFVQEVKIRG